MNHIFKESCSATHTRMIRGVLPVMVTRVQNHAARGFLDLPAVLFQIDPRKKETPMETHQRCLCVCDMFFSNICGHQKKHDQTWHVFPLEVLLWPAANTKNFPWDQLINFQVIILTNLTDLIKQLDLIQFKMCGSTATVSSWCSLWVMNWDKSSPSSCFDNAHVFLSTNCIRFGMIYRRHCKM